jgi:hypothetical protein
MTISETNATETIDSDICAYHWLGYLLKDLGIISDFKRCECSSSDSRALACPMDAARYY